MIYVHVQSSETFLYRLYIFAIIQPLFFVNILLSPPSEYISGNILVMIVKGRGWVTYISDTMKGLYLYLLYVLPFAQHGVDALLLHG